jgi:hypothetical protein
MTTYSADSFNRADSTTNLGSTDGAGTLDPLAWSQRNGTWGISSNQGYTSAAASQSVATIASGNANAEISVTVAASGAAGIAFRWSSSNNYWRAFNSGTSTFLEKRVAGSNSSVGSAAGAAVGDVLRVVCNGSSIEVFRNGVSIISTTDSFNSTAQNHGLYINGNTTARLDDFSVDSVSQRAVVPFLDASPVLHSPRVDPLTISVPLLDASPTLHQPAVQDTNQTITVPQLTATPTLHDPAVTWTNLNVVAPLLANTPTLYAPSVGQPTTPTGATVPAFVVRTRDIDGSSAVTLASAQPEEIIWTLNEPTEFRIVSPKHAYDTDDIPTLSTATGPPKRFQVFFDDDLLAQGVAIQNDAQGSRGELTTHCADPMWLLNRLNIDAPRDSYIDNGSFESGYTSWDHVGSFTATTVSTRKLLGSDSAKFVNATADADAYKRQRFSAGPNGVGLLLTVVGYYFIESITAPALGSRGLFLQGSQGGELQDYNYWAIDAATPTNKWERAEFTLTIPPGEVWDMELRVYAPQGTIYWDALAVVAMDSTGATSVTGSAAEEADIAAITRVLVHHMQDSSKGKAQLYLGRNCPNTGVKLFRQYQYAEHIGFGEAVGEFVNRDDGFDISITDTPTTWSFTTHYPNKGTDRSATVTLKFDQDAGASGKNVSDYRFSRDGAGAITRATSIGSGDGPDREEGEYVDTSQLGGLVLQEARQAAPDASINSLLPTARDRVKKRRKPPLLLELDIDHSAYPSAITTLKVGDRVNVVIDDGYVQVSGTRRIVKSRLNCRTRVLTATINEELD